MSYKGKTERRNRSEVPIIYQYTRRNGTCKGVRQKCGANSAVDSAFVGIVEKDERSVVSSKVFPILVYESLHFPPRGGGFACRKKLKKSVPKFCSSEFFHYLCSVGDKETKPSNPHTLCHNQSTPQPSVQSLMQRKATPL
jgi:hypothetical protein